MKDFEYNFVNVLVAIIRGPARRVEIRFVCGPIIAPTFLIRCEAKYFSEGLYYNNGMVKRDYRKYPKNPFDLMECIEIAKQLSCAETPAWEPWEV